MASKAQEYIAKLDVAELAKPVLQGSGWQATVTALGNVDIWRGGKVVVCIGADEAAALADWLRETFVDGYEDVEIEDE